MTKLKYCYSHLKSFVFMFWIVSFMFLNHLNIPHTPNSLFPSSFLLFFPNTLPNLFQILHCFMHYKPRQFRSFLSLSFFFLLLRTLPTSLHLEWCATPCILLFQQRNAHYLTSFLNSSNVTDSSFFFMLLLTHWRITSWNKQYFPAFNNLYSSS